MTNGFGIFAESIFILKVNYAILCTIINSSYLPRGIIINKVLLVEDNPQNALLIRRVLEARNYEVVHTVEGETGLNTAISDPPDIILVDLGLPDMDGQTLVSIIKHTPELKDIPLIAVTAWPEDTARQMVQAYGCDGFISKPINTRTFADQIGQFLTQS